MSIPTAHGILNSTAIIILGMLHYEEEIKRWLKEHNTMDKLKALFALAPEMETLFADAKTVYSDDPAVKKLVADLLAIEASLKEIK